MEPGVIYGASNNCCGANNKFVEPAKLVVEPNFCLKPVLVLQVQHFGRDPASDPWAGGAGHTRRECVHDRRTPHQVHGEGGVGGGEGGNGGGKGGAGDAGEGGGADGADVSWSPVVIK